MNKLEKILLASTCGLGAVSITFISLFVWKILNNNNDNPTPEEDKNFTVTWDLDNGSELITEKYKEGEIPSYKGDTPTKEGTGPLTEEEKRAGKDECSYTFKGWDKEFAPIDSDVTYKAIYNVHSYVTKISFKAETISAGKKVGFNFTYTAGENDIFVNWGDQQCTTVDPGVNYIEHTYEVTIRKDFSILVYGSIASLSNLNTSEVYANLELSNTHIAIDSYSFSMNNYITSIYISRTVKTIDHSAFYRCFNLFSVTFEEDSQLETIVDWAFFYCSSLNSIIIPRSVKTIGIDSFSYTNLSSVTFEKDSCLETIGYEAFSDTGITSITIPKSTKTIGGGAFHGCGSLFSLIFEKDSQLEMINDLAFDGIYSLTVVDLTGFVVESEDSIPSLASENVFPDSKSLTFYVANNKMLDIFTKKAYWSNYADKFTTNPVPTI